MAQLVFQLQYRGNVILRRSSNESSTVVDGETKSFLVLGTSSAIISKHLAGIEKGREGKGEGKRSRSGCRGKGAHGETGGDGEVAEGSARPNGVDAGCRGARRRTRRAAHPPSLPAVHRPPPPPASGDPSPKPLSMPSAGRSESRRASMFQSKGPPQLG